MTVEDEQKYRTIEGLKTHPLWFDLTDKQKVFLEHYLLTGKRSASVKAAYSVASDTGAGSMASKLLREYAVRMLIAAYRGLPTRDTKRVSRTELQRLISERIRDINTSSAEFQRLSKLLAEITGWRDKYPAGRPRKEEEQPEEPEDELMVLIRQYEKEQEHRREQE